MIGSNTICNAPMEGSNHMTYTPKGLVNDTIGAPLEPYKEQELLIPKQCGIPYTIYSYIYHMGYHNLPLLNSRHPRRASPS